MKYLARLLIVIFITASFVPLSASAIGTNFRAQGHYYSAKEALKMGNYDKALHYVYQSKQALKGTNPELQYLHILSAYRAERFSEAQKEMETFFEIAEDKIKPVYFDKDVDRLTSDEEREITMLMNKIDESVIAENEAQRERERNDRAAKELSGVWVITDGPSNHIGAKTLVLKQSEDTIEAYSTDKMIMNDGEEYHTSQLYGKKTGENADAVDYVGWFSHTYKAYCDWDSSRNPNFYDRGSGWGENCPNGDSKITYHKKNGTLTFRVPNEINNDCNTRCKGYRDYTLKKQ